MFFKYKATALAAFAGVLVSGAAFADSKPLFPVLACPAVGEEYEKMIAKLDSIKASVKTDANCTNVELKVKNLEDLVTKDREEVMEIINRARAKQGQTPVDPGTVQGQVQAQAATALTPEEMTKVRNYAENVTKKVAALNDLFMQNNYCFRGDKPDNQLASLAGFVGEAANMVGSLAGPWGTPIALAGNVIAGFMTGMDMIFKSRAGYDFDDRAQWISYVQNLCTYHSYRDQIEHLLNPIGRVSQLRALQDKLDAQIRVMERECADCRVIANGYHANASGMNQSELLETLGGHIEAADRQNEKPYGTYMIQSLGLRDWTLEEIKRVQKEAQTYWADATGRHLLSQAKADIEQFLIAREGPNFLRHGVAQSRRDYQEFATMIGTEGRTVYMMLMRSNPGVLPVKLSNPAWTDPMEMFRALVIQPLNWEVLEASQQRDEMQFTWTHFRDQSLDRFRTSLASTQVVQSFCSFFKHAGYYGPDIRDNCNSGYFKRQILEQNLLTNELTAAKINMGPINGTFRADPSEGQSLTAIEAITKEIEERRIGN